jgi:murein DD-endopeptidase MepM/ murein hydrolase activator NlpD
MYGVVALLAVAAILLTNPLPPRANTPAGEILSDQHVSHVIQRHDTVASGETLAGVLARGGLSEVLVREALKTATMLDPRRIRVGTPVLVRSDSTDTLNTEVILQLAVDRILHLKRGAGGWTAEEQRLPWKNDTIVVHAVIKSTLYEAMDDAARDLLPLDARRELTWALADIYEYRVDMSRDLQIGDSFRVLTERSVGPNGAVRMGRILAATTKLSGTTIEAMRFNSQKVAGDFFDQNGRSLRAGFLRAPVQFRRISSRFGMRRHPILGTMRRHQGTDYAADAGTPVRSIGEGVVVRAGWHNGYGNLVEIRHKGGYVTRYGHMRGFAKGVYSGAHVAIAQNVGFVGSTGLSTGPHLHFELLVNGVQRNPSIALRNASSDPIPAAERIAYTEARSRLVGFLESPRILASAESATVKQTGSKAQ